MRHTKGPWAIEETDHDTFEIAGKPDGFCAEIVLHTRFENPLDAQRIVDCVNACEGIANPSVVPELVEALEELTDYLIVNSIESERGVRLRRSMKALARARGEQS